MCKLQDLREGGPSQSIDPDLTPTRVHCYLANTAMQSQRALEIVVQFDVRKLEVARSAITAGTDIETAVKKLSL